MTKQDCLPGVIHEERKILFHTLDQLCANENLNCIYVHGPLHEEVATCSLPQINAIREVVRGEQRIIPVEKLFLYPFAKMGDAVDHIDREIRAEVTKEYFEAIKLFLK